MYNKSEFNKVNDKKVLHKVKKQWVTISISMLAMLGASGVAISGPAHASANDNNQSNQPKTTEVESKNANSGQSTTNNQSGSNSVQADSQNSNDNKSANNNNSATPQASTNEVKTANKPTAPAASTQQPSSNGSSVGSKGANPSTAKQPAASNSQQSSSNAASSGSAANKSSDQASSAFKSNDAGTLNSQSTGTPKSNSASQSSAQTSSAQPSSAAKTATSSSVANSSASVKNVSSQSASAGASNSQIKNNASNPFANLNLASINSRSGLQNALTQLNVSSGITEAQKQADQGAIAAWNSIHSDDIKNSDSSVDTNSDAYKAGYKGLADAWKKYNDLNSSKGTSNSKNYTNTDMNGKNPSDPHSVDSNLDSNNDSIGNDNPEQISKDKQAQIINDPNAKHQNTSESNNSFSASTNIASDDAVNNYNNQVTFDDKNNITINQNNQNYYNQGVTDFLKYQGTYDAENGRWNGKKQNEVYTPDQQSDNAYDQAYMGAQNAISQQFHSDGTLSYINSSSGQKQDFANVAKSNSGNDNYNNGFQDVVNKVNNGTSFVSNGTQLSNALFNVNQYKYSDKDVFNGSGNYYGNINNVKFVQDFGLNGMNVDGTGNYAYIEHFSGVNNINLTLDGQNHITDYKGLTYSIRDFPQNSQTLTVKNFKTIYGGNYYGPDKIENNGGTVNYDNVTYVGPQLINATGAQVNVNNNLNIFSVGSYQSPFGSNTTVDKNFNINGKYYDNQENFEIANMEIKSGAHYYGSTTGGTAVNVGSGNFQVDSGASVKLAPMATTQGKDTGGDTSNGIYLNGGSSKLTIQPNADVTIIPQGLKENEGAAQGIYDAGNITINGGKLNININGNVDSRTSNYNYVSGSILVNNNGEFNIRANNLDSSNQYNSTGTGNLLTATGLNISNQGNMNISTDGSGKPTLFQNNGNLNIDNPGKQVVLAIDNNGSGTLFSGGSLNGYSVKYSYSKDTSKNGAINEYTSDPHYQIKIDTDGTVSYDQLNGGNYSVSTDPEKHNVSGARYLSFDATPNAFFDGSINVQHSQGQAQGVTQGYAVNGKLRLENLPSNVVAGQPQGDNGRVYIQVSADNSNLSNDAVKNSNINLVDKNGKVIASVPYDANSNSDELSHSGNNNSINVPQNNGSTQSSAAGNTVTYTDSIRLPKEIQNGDEIEFSYQLPGRPKSNITVQTHYFVMNQKQSMDSNGNVTTTLENPLKGPEELNKATNNPGMVPLNVNTASSDGIDDGIHDADQNITDQAGKVDPTKGYNWNNDPTYKDKNEDIRNAYKNSYSNAYNGYKRAQTDSNSSNYNPNQYSSNNDAYKQGYQAYNNNVKNGFNYVINNKDNSDTNITNAYKNGEGMAHGVQNTVNGSYDGSSADSNQKAGHDSFNQGWDANNSNPSSLNTTKNAYDPAYHYGTQMSNGFKDAKTNSTANQPNKTADSDDSENYDADNNAYQNGKNAYSGMNDVLTDQKQGTNNSDGKSSTNKDAYNAAYDATNAGLNSDTTKSAKTYNNQQQQYVYDAGRAARTGIDDALNGNQNPTNNRFNNDNQNDNYSKAFTAAKNGLDAKAGTPAPTDNSNDQSQLTAYNAGQAAKTGISDENVGKPSNEKPNDYNNGNWNQLQKSSYDNARSAYQYGMSDNSNPSDSKATQSLAAYNAGKDAKTGIDAAIKGTSSADFDKTTPSSNAKDAFQATQDGMRNNSGSEPTNDLDRQQLNAYTMGQAVKAAVSDGNAHQDGNLSQNSRKDSWSKAQKTAYDNALTAYNDGSGVNPTKNHGIDDKQNFAYQQGQNADAIKAGINNGAADNPIDSDGNAKKNDWNDAQKQAYTNAYKAYQDGYKGNHDDSNADNKQSVAYNVGQAARAGALDASNNNSNDQYDPKTQWSQQQKQAYVDAKQAYNKGDGNSTPYANKGGAPVANNKAEDVQRLAYNDGLTSKAVKDGQDDARSGQNIKDGQNGNGTYSSNSSKQQAYTDSYQAYQDGLNGNHNNQSSENAQKNSYNLGKAARAGIHDAENDVIQISTNPESEYKKNTPEGGWSPQQSQEYTDARASYAKGFNSTQATADYGKNEPAYQAGQAAKDGMNDAVDGNGNQVDKKGYQNQNQKDAYTKAQSDYNSGKQAANQTPTNQVTKPDSNKSIPYNKGLAVQTAVNDKENGTINSNFSGNNDYGYSDAQKNFDAGNGQKPSGFNPSQNSDAYKAGLAYNSGITDAANKINDVNDPSHNHGDQASYQKANDNFNAGFGNQVTTPNFKASQNSQAYQNGQAAKQGASDAINKQDQSKNGGNYVGNQSYENAHQAAQDGFNNPSGQSSNGQNAAYDIGKNARNGADAALSGKNDDSTTNPNNDSDFTNAYNAAKHGLDNSQGSKPTSNDAKSQSAYDMGQAAQKGMNDASDGHNNNPYASDPNEKAQSDAYEKAYANFESGLKGQQTGTNNPDTNSEAYQAGEAAKTGQSDAAKGIDNKSAYPSNNKQQAAYQKANDNFNAGFGNQVTTPNFKASQQSEAYQAGQAAKQGQVAALAGKDNNATTNPKSNSDFTNAYNAAKNGLDGNNNGEPTDQDKTNQPSYDAGSQARAGQAAALAGKDNNTTTNPNGNNDFTNSYNAAKRGLDGNNNGEPTDQDKTNQPSYDAGSQARAGQAAALAGKDNNNTTNPKSNSDFTNAYNATKHGLDGDNNGQATKDDQKNQPSYDAGSQARAGQAAALAGKDNNNTTNPKGNSDFTNAYNAAKHGLDGNNTPTPEDKNNDASYQAGQAARNGINDTEENNGKNATSYGYQPNSNNASAYNQAQQQYNDGNSDSKNNNLNTPQPNKSVAYNAGVAANTGMNDAINGTNNPDNFSLDPNNPENKAYTNAQKAYQAGLIDGNNDNSDNPDKSLNPTAYQAGQNANKGMQDGIGNKPKDQKAYDNNPAYKNAYDNAQSARQGAIDAINGKQSNPRQPGVNNSAAYQDAYNEAKNNDDSGINDNDKTPSQIAAKVAHAAQDGINDAKQNKNAANDPNSNYNKNWKPIQKGSYNNAQDAYNAGNKGDQNSQDAQKNKDANDEGYNNYVANNQPTSEPTNNDQTAGQQAGQQAFIGGSPFNINTVNLAGKSDAYKQAYNKAYNSAQNGFAAGLNGNPNNKQTDQSYSAGYRSAQAYKQGSIDATQGKKPRNNSSYSYKLGYNSYNKGLNGQKISKSLINKLAPEYRRAYEQNYARGHAQYKQDVKNGAENGRKNANSLKQPNLSGQNSAYVKAYKKAYQQAMKKQIPHYVYNLGKMYRYSHPKMNRKDRVMKYRHTLRPNRHVFRVLGYKFNAKGQLMYRVRGGWITASRKHIDDAYYRHSHNGADTRHIKVIKRGGTYVYNSKQFTPKHVVRFLKTGTKIHVRGAVKLDSITRFYIGNGEYISSNKTIVREIH